MCKFRVDNCANSCYNFLVEVCFYTHFRPLKCKGLIFMKTLGIKKIIMYRRNGMYEDRYDVFYNLPFGGTTYKTYTVNGAMHDKHFNWIMSHKCIPHYRKNGYHNYDTFE